MNVLVLTDLYPPFPGGAEAQVGRYARFLMQQGETVRVLTGYAAAQQFDGPPVVTAAIGIGADREAGWYMIETMLTAFKPDIVLTHHLYARTFSAELEACGIPVVQIVLNGPRLEFAALAVFISEWVRGQAGNARPDDLTILPPVFAADVKPDHLGECLGFVKPIPHKGVDLIYRLAEAMPEREFLILHGEWRTLEDIRPMPNVSFMEPVERMSEFYQHCRVMLMPSVSEDAGSVCQEATVCGMPCIASDVGGLSETGAGGILLAPNGLGAPWVRAVRSLDDPVFYAHVVERQSKHLAARDQDGQLAEFHKRLVALV